MKRKRNLQEVSAERPTLAGAAMMGYGGHSGARMSGKRSYVYYPFVDATRAIDEWTRSELVRKAAWAYDEIGWVGGLVDNSAKMCGKLSQKATTGDDAWNMEADRVFELLTGSAENFDLAGKHDWKSLVKAFFKGRFRLGDCGVVLAKNEIGAPVIKFIPGHAIGNDKDTTEQDGWFDGLKLDKHGKAQKYRVLDACGGFTDYDRKNFIFHISHDKPEMVRGLPKTYRMINKVQDQEEIESFWSGGIKASSQVAMQIVNSKTDSGAGNGMGTAVSAKRTQAREKPEIYQYDLDADSKILEMGDERIELLHDQRPAPDQVNYLDYQKRDCAAGFGLPIEAVWAWGNASSAITRTLLMQVQDFIDDEQGLFISQCGVRLRNWVISCAMEMGMLRPCSDPAWWAHTWMHGARKTADFAKDGRIYLEALNRGQLSPDRYYAMQDLDVDVEDRVTVARWKKRSEMCAAAGLHSNYVFPPAPGTPVPPDVADNLNEKEDDE